MSGGYQVIARKWRPKRFDEVVGQSAVVRTLSNALEQQRLAHAYCFSGIRGVGKTTIARLLAKGLNCRASEGPTPTPCGRCESCVEIESSRSLDVLERDAASDRGIDEMRQLVEVSRYAPSRDRYKVFILDEAHMLTREASNALLKVLEEPPAWIVFMLATTEPQKILPTILSRCQHYQLGRISQRGIVGHLSKIASAEGVQISDDALALVATAADGSLRDGQSLLDKLIAFSGETIDENTVIDLLGLVDRVLLFRATELVAAGDVAGTLRFVDEMVDSGVDLHQFTVDLLGHFRNLLIVRTVREAGPILHLPDGDIERLREQASSFSVDDLDRAFSLLAGNEYRIKTAEQPRYHVEIVLARLARMPSVEPIGELLAQLRGEGGDSGGGTSAGGGGGGRRTTGPAATGPSAGGPSPKSSPDRPAPRPTKPKSKPEPRPEPVAKAPEPEPKPEPVAKAPEPEPEPEPAARAAEAAKPEAAAKAPEPEPKPVPVATPRQAEPEEPPHPADDPRHGGAATDRDHTPERVAETERSDEPERSAETERHDETERSAETERHEETERSAETERHEETERSAETERHDETEPAAPAPERSDHEPAPEPASRPTPGDDLPMPALLRKIQEQVATTHPLIAQVLDRCGGISLAGQRLDLQFAKSHGIFVQRLRDPEVLQLLGQAARAVTGREVVARVEMSDSVSARLRPLSEDPLPEPPRPERAEAPRPTPQASEPPGAPDPTTNGAASPDATARSGGPEPVPSPVPDATDPEVLRARVEQEPRVQEFLKALRGQIVSVEELPDR